MSSQDKTATTNAQGLPNTPTAEDNSSEQLLDQTDTDFGDKAMERLLSSKRLQNATNMAKSAMNEAGKLKSIYKDPQRQGKEKLRGILSYWVTPGIQMRYFEEPETNNHTLDIDLLPDTLIGDTDSFSVPRRMFDVDDRNMVDTFSLSPEDEYCMLSHSWKGQELDMSFFAMAQKMVKGKDNDLDGVLEYCKVNLEEKEKALMEHCNTSDSAAIRDILSRYIEAKDIEWRYTCAKSKRREADSKRASSRNEKERYKEMIRKVPWLKVHGESGRLEFLEDREEGNQANQDDEISELREKVEKHRPNFGRDAFYAINDMLQALQRRRSARKLQHSIDQAQRIFDEKPYLSLGKRYIWLDTCCIDKSNSSELTESLARMGDWYANADFCLVHLDTGKDDKDWLDEWDLWKGRSLTRESKPLEHFGGIEEWEPTWSTRGWTLQELVLSKMTYFVNPDWKLLERDIDNLGRYYSLCPFIELYTGSSCHAHTDKLDFEKLASDIKPWIKDHRSSAESKPKGNSNTRKEQKRQTAVPLLTSLFNALTFFIPKQPNVTRESEPNVKEQWDKRTLIIHILEAFDFVIPRQLTEDNARLRIGQSVRHTIQNLKDQMLSSDNEHQEPTTSVYLLQRLRRDLNIPTGSKDGKDIKPVIDFLLNELANSSIDEIVKDRGVISSFSKVDLLKSWSRGIRRDNFSAHSVMNLASERSVTVPTDTAYSLMGILRVQFPAFPAEGLPKALGRLMDEVVITSNDVSVFNWSGKHSISPLKGRSLYPSNIGAFQIENLKGAKNVDRELVRLSRKERTKYLRLVRQVNLLLAHAAKYAASVESNGSIECLRKLVDFITGKDFHIHNHSVLLQCLLSSMDLLEKMEAASRLVDAINTEKAEDQGGKNETQKAAETRKASTPTQDQNKQSEDANSETGEPEKEKTWRPLGQGSTSLLNLKPDLKWQKDGTDKQEATEETAVMTEGSNAVEEQKEQSENTAAKIEDREKEKKWRPFGFDSASMSSFGRKMKWPGSEDDTEKQRKPSQNRVNLECLKPQIRMAIDQTLETQSDGVKIKRERLQEGEKKEDGKKENGKKEGTRKEDGRKEEGKRKQENQAERKKSNKPHGSRLERLDEPIVCPNPIVVNSSGITGVFDIQRVVMTILDPEKLRSKIKNAASAYEMIDGWCTISTGLGFTMVAFSCERHMLKQQMDVADVMEENVLKDPLEKRPEPAAPDQGQTPGVAHNPTEHQSEEKTLKAYGNSPEQRKVSRMIDFVTESDLHVVAGEWVLARFSGSPGAKWFLCRLELGNGNTFYARRIATDDFDFHEALPEEGLVQYWYEYLRAKKTSLCDFLSRCLEKKSSMIYKRWPSNPMQDPAGEENDYESESGDDEKNGDEPDENMKQKNQYWGLRPMNKFNELFERVTEGSPKWEEFLDNVSRDRAMANVPTRQQAAIEALDKDKGLLPIMFHSARDVHFF